MTLLSVGSYQLLRAREAALPHLDVAPGAHQLLEQTADFLPGALFAPYLPASRALPRNRLEETADLPSASRAKAADHYHPWVMHV